MDRLAGVSSILCEIGCVFTNLHSHTLNFQHQVANHPDIKVLLFVQNPMEKMLDISWFLICIFWRWMPSWMHTKWWTTLTWCKGRPRENKSESSRIITCNFSSFKWNTITLSASSQSLNKGSKMNMQIDCVKHNKHLLYQLFLASLIYLNIIECVFSFKCDDNLP